MSARSRFFVLALAAASMAGACVDLSEDLEGEPCTVEDDCWHTQECSQTAEEVFYNLPGVCAPEGTGCVPGGQLGCTCTPGDAVAGCFAPALPLPLHPYYPRMTCDPTLFRCVFAPEQGGN